MSSNFTDTVTSWFIPPMFETVVPQIMVSRPAVMVGVVWKNLVCRVSPLVNKFEFKNSNVN